MAHYLYRQPLAIATLITAVGLGSTAGAATAQSVTEPPAPSIADAETTIPAVQYLDDLQDCVAGSQAPPVPMPFLETAMAVPKIIGEEDGTCVVETTIFLATAPDTQTTLSYCQHAPATIALMTDDIAYEQARTGNYSFSTDSDRYMALSAAMEAECELNFNWVDELNL